MAGAPGCAAPENLIKIDNTLNDCCGGLSIDCNRTYEEKEIKKDIRVISAVCSALSRVP